MRTLLRAQLRLALRILVALGLTIGVLPLLFHLVPALGDDPAAGDAAGLAAARRRSSTPCCVFLGWRYVRRAERNERDFAPGRGAS